MNASPNEPNPVSINAVERFRRRMDDGHVCLGVDHVVGGARRTMARFRAAMREIDRA